MVNAKQVVADVVIATTVAAGACGIALSPDAQPVSSVPATEVNLQLKAEAGQAAHQIEQSEPLVLQQGEKDAELNNRAGW